MTAIMDIFTMDAATAGWLMSIFTFVGIFIAIPTGNLAQRFGFKKMMLAASALVVLGSALGIVAGTSAVLIVSRAIEGIALTVITLCGPIAINQVVKPERVGLALGIWGNWGGAGAVIAGVVTPLVFENFGFTWVWIIFAAFAALAAILVLFFVHDSYAKARKEGKPVVLPGSEGQDGDQTAALAASSPPRYKELANRNTVLFLFGFSTFNLALLALLGYLPAILQQQGFSVPLSGITSTLPSLLCLLANPIYGAISDKLGKVKPLLIGTFVTFGPCVAIMYNNTGALLWVGAVVLGLVGMGCIGLFLIGWAKVLPRPELISIAMGVLVLVQCIGQFLGTALVQLLLGPNLDQWFFASMVILVLCLLGTASLLACRIKE
jgi:MFS family permease